MIIIFVCVHIFTSRSRLDLKEGEERARSVVERFVLRGSSECVLSIAP